MSSPTPRPRRRLDEDVELVDPRDLPEGAVLRGSVVRRARLTPFLVTGAVIGLLLAVFVALLGPDAPNASPTQELILLGLLGALLGGLSSSVLYLLVERRTGR